MAYENVWRIAAVKTLAVASAAGAAVSTTSVGAQTYAVQFNFPGSVSSTGGVRIAIGRAPSASQQPIC